jgi:phage terminase Nu1 subunit (DNA packaging protein)
MIVNKVTFAEIAGVGKASVTLSVQRGKLIENSDGFIDTENAINKAYIEKRNKKEKQARPEKEQKKNTATKPPKIEQIDLPEPDDIELPGEIDDQDQFDQMDKLAVEIRLKKAQAMRHELKYEQDKGFLIPVESVERAAAKVGSEIKIRLQDLPRRIIPRIFSLVKSGATDIDVQELLEREIDDGIEAIRLSLEAEIV